MRDRHASTRGRKLLGWLTTGLVLSVGMLASAVLATPLTHSAHAAPDGGLSVSFSQLGRATDVPLPRDSSAVLVTIPVPDGMTADAITGTLAVPSDLREGWVEIDTGAQRLQRIAVQASDIDNGIALSVPLAGVEVVDRSLTISIASHYVPVDDRCFNQDAFAPFTVHNAAVLYSGAERQPASVSEFFPTLLRKLTIFVPQDADKVTQTAALALSADMVQEYGSQPVQVAIAELPAGGAVPAIEPQVFERNVVLGASATGVISLQSAANGLPVLMITGNEKTLVPQVHLLAANFDGFWSASKALASAEEPVGKISENVVTLDQLNIAPLTASGLTHFAVPLQFSQAQLGRAVANLSLNLFGTYVPLPTSRSGTLSVNMGTTRLASVPLDPSGKFDLNVAVPAGLLTRSIAMSVDIDVTGDFACGVSDGSALNVDPRSTISSDVAASPLPGGFQSLPQTLLPTMNVGLKDGGLDDLRRAALIIVEQQRMSYAPLVPQVIAFDDAAKVEMPTLLVAAEGGAPSTLKLPLDSVDPVLLTMNGVASNAPIATLQTAQVGGKAVLVASTNGAGSDLDNLLGWLTTDMRMQGLAGDLLVGPRGAAPFTLAVNVAAAPPLAVVTPDGGLSVPAIIGIAVGTGALIAAAVGLTLALRRRRR